MHNGRNHNGSTPNESLIIIKLVDGAGSGLDADLLDGISSASLALAATTISAAGLATGGGSLAESRTITVPAATDAEARDLASSSVALTPANLAARACFSANKNGVAQNTFPDTTATLVTFDTEAFDIGGYFASDAWTPPAGPVRLSASVQVSGLDATAGVVKAIIYKNGSAFRAGAYALAVAGVGVGQVTCIDIANGTDAYTVRAYIDATTTGTVSGSGAGTYFQGEQI